MKSHSIEWIHSKIEKQIRLVESYSELPSLSFIIKSCRLTPHNYIVKKHNKIVLHRWWVDEFGNSLEFKKKKPYLVFNDLRLNRSKIACTDLYYGLSLSNIIKISKLVYIIAGKDEDLHEDYYFISFLGIDNHLRSYLYFHNEWKIVSPLLMGLKNLKLIAQNIDLKYFRTIKNRENLAIPCEQSQAWISYLPANKDFLKVLKEKNENLLTLMFHEI